MTDRVILAITTFPDAVSARSAATVLLQKKLVACANILPQVESIYWWKEELETATEVLVLWKTRASLFPRLQEELVQLHPYEVPELLAIEISQGLPAYLQWVMESTTGEGRGVDEKFLTTPS